MTHLFARELSNPTPYEANANKREHYLNAAHEALLEDNGIRVKVWPRESITEDIKTLCQTLLTNTQEIPQDTPFRDNIFLTTCSKLRGRNKERIIDDISRLIAPSAVTLPPYGATELNHLVMHMNEPWSMSIPFTPDRPQPDFCVGFDRDALIMTRSKK